MTLALKKATDFSVSQINDIIDKRLRKKLSTIITTNFSLTDIDKTMVQELYHALMLTLIFLKLLVMILGMF